MYDIIVKRVDAAKMFIETTLEIRGELYKYFSAFAENYKWNPKYKQKVWDGKIRAFDIKTSQLPIGLYYRLIQFAKENEYTINFEFPLKEKVDYAEFEAFVAKLEITDDYGKPLELRDFQLKAIYDIICRKVLNVSSVTGSGKSVILYVVTRWFLSKGQKVVCVLNQIQLVEQIISDFYNYGWKEVNEKVTRIYGGTDRLIERDFVATTWQSTYTKLDQFEKFGVLLIDEADLSAAKSINSITKACTNAYVRCGVSGSFPGPETAAWMTIVGATGPIINYSTYKSLQEAGQLSELELTVVRLIYPASICEYNYQNNIAPNMIKDSECTAAGEQAKSYVAELDYVNNLPERNKFLAKLVGSLTGNTLILFTKKEKHGIPLYKYMKQVFPQKKIFYVDGDISIQQRELIRKSMELYDDVLLLASYGTFARGTNIKRLHNIIAASNYKKQGKILQAIGRSLRLHKTKEVARMFDIVDDLTFKKNKVRYYNYALKQIKERITLYKSKEFNYKLKEYRL